MGRGAGTWSRRAGLLALLTLACGAPGSGPAQTAPEPTPAAPAPAPAQAPTPPPPVCPGGEALTPEPALSATLPCTETVYEGDGRLRQRTLRRFDAQGRLLLHERQGPDGATFLVERRSVDEAGRLTLRETPELRAQWSLDVCGRPARLEERGPAGRLQVTHATYDALGRLTDVQRSLEAPDSTGSTELRHLDYAPEGHLLRSELHLTEGARTTQELRTYDAQGRVTEEVLTQSGPGTQPQRVTRRSEYDAQGRLVRTQEWRDEQPALTTDYEYDGGGRLLRVEHDVPGSSGWRERRAYDGAGRPTEVLYEEVEPDGLARPVTRWSCSYAQGLARVERYHESSAPSGWTRRYDARGLLVDWTEEDFQAGSFLHGSAAYDGAGELTRKEEVRNTSGNHWTYLEEHSYDAAGRRTQTDAQSQSESGAGASYAFTRHRWGYDAAGRTLLQETWDLAGPHPVLLLRTESRFDCGPAVH